MNINEVKACIDGDKAIRLGHRCVYDWHLTHTDESRCKFTLQSVQYAITRNDIRLLKQLLNVVSIDDKFLDIRICKNVEILDLVLPRIQKNSYTLLRNIDNKYISDYIMNNVTNLDHKCIIGFMNIKYIDYIYDKNLFDDELMYCMMNYNDKNMCRILKISDKLKYISDKGYKWSYKHCLNIMNNNNLELIKYLWKYGDGNYTQKDDLNNILNKVWNYVAKGDRRLFDILCTIDSNFKKLMIIRLISTTFIQYIPIYNYDILIDYLSTMVYEFTKDSIKLSFGTIVMLYMITDNTNEVVKRNIKLKYAKSDKETVDNKAKELNLYTKLRNIVD